MALSCQYRRDSRSANTSTADDAATANHAARVRVKTSNAATSATLSDPAIAPADVRAVTAEYIRAGSPIVTKCATKLRFPNVPPGARFWLKNSESNPYACTNPVTAATTVVMAAPTMIGRYDPAAPIWRAPQKRTTLDTLTPSARCASQWFVAKTVDATLHARNTTSSPSTTLVSLVRARATSRIPTMRAVRCRTSSFGTKNRSSSKSL